jgi:lysyl-tRNA synthetase, class II
MADPVVDEAGENVGALHLDDVTGESISKSELKRRQKQRARDDKKQKAKDEKKEQGTAAAPLKSEGRKVAEDDESNLTPNVRN